MDVGMFILLFAAARGIASLSASIVREQWPIVAYTLFENHIAGCNNQL